MYNKLITTPRTPIAIFPDKSDTVLQYYINTVDPGLHVNEKKKSIYLHKRDNSLQTRGLRAAQQRIEVLYQFQTQ